MIYTRDSCKSVKLNNEKEPILIKPIEQILQAHPSNESLKAENLFVLDDRETTFMNNEKNGILIPAYTPDFGECGLYDHALEKLERWLLREDVIKSNDVRTLDKSRIFK